MKAKLLLICLFAFLALCFSSCFLKQKYHFNDHRGYYPDKGRSKVENTAKRKKHHRRRLRQHKRHVKHLQKQRANARPVQKAQTEPDSKEPKYQTDWKDSAGQKNTSAPKVQNVQPVQPQIIPETKVQPDQAVPSVPDVPKEQPEQKEPKHKKKHKKEKKEQSEPSAPADGAKADTTGGK